MVNPESLQAKVERYLAYGFHIKPNGAVYNPHDGSEVDWLDVEVRVVQEAVSA